MTRNLYSVLSSARGPGLEEFLQNLQQSFTPSSFRNHYLCAVKAAKIMTKQKSGLIVNVSSPGGKTYIFTPAYGIGKAGSE